MINLEISETALECDIMKFVEISQIQRAISRTLIDTGSISFSIEVGDVKTEDERLGIALVIADAIQKLRDKHKVEVIPVLKNKA